jgi:cephalosporin-C deacetylase
MSYDPYLPEDFEEFWQETLADALSAPLDYRRSLRNEYDLPGFAVETLTFRGIGGNTLHGWIAAPHGAYRLPSFLWVPPYGRESLLPNAYGTREGMTSLSFNFHGHEAFHQEKYQPSRGYLGEGVDLPTTWVFRAMFQNAILAARVLQAQPESDESRIGAMGMSQGGGIALWLGAWLPFIKAVAADMPFMSAIKYTLQRQVYRYPLKELVDVIEEMPLGQERVFNTISYFDTMNQATKCAVPTWVSRGLKDPSVRPDVVDAVFQALPGTKHLETYDWGHDWHPDMITKNREWLLRYLA